MKKKADELRSKLESITVTEVTNGITIDCNANRKILAVHISEEHMSNKTNLEENMVLAVNNALAAAEKAALGDVAAIAGGVPGLGNLFGK